MNPSFSHTRKSYFSTLPAAMVACVCFIFMIGIQAAYAQDTVTPLEPGEVVQSLTHKLLDVARNGQGRLESEPELFYQEIEGVLEPMVSFRFIAKNVMGDTYWRKASDQQQEAFLAVFKRSLVETYVKGMSQNLDYDIELVEGESKVLKNKASIVQKITGPEDVTLVVYTLGLGKSGQWKVLNLVLDGVNLGKTFRGQFAQAMKENSGNIDAAIAGWAGKT